MPNYLGEIYGINAPGGFIMIDSGYTKETLELVAENLAYYGLPEKPEYIILTHAHFDHCGNAKAYQERGVKIIVGAEDAYQCVNGGSAGLGMPTPFDDAHIYPAFKPDKTIDADCAIELCGLSLRLIKIPGHTPGSLAVMAEIDGKKALFTGDALNPQGNALFDSVSLGWQGDIMFSREAIVNSMMHLMKVAPDADMIMPGHGKVCLRNGGAMIRLAAQTAFMTMR